MAKKILLADDSITIQKVVELTFSDGDYEIIAVNNGAKAIQKLQEIRPDIILSDIIMPEKNGYEVCEFVKSHPDYKTIPVILLTGTFEPFDPDRAERAGCDAVVTKPFESQSLIHKVDELVQASAAAAAPPAAPAGPQPSPFDETQSTHKTEAAPAASAEDEPFAEPPPPSPEELFGFGPAPAADRSGSVFDETNPPRSAPESEPPFGASAPTFEEPPAFSGEATHSPKMAFDDPPSSAFEPPQPPAAQPDSTWSAATTAFPKMSFADLQKLRDEAPAQPSASAPAEEPASAPEPLEWPRAAQPAEEAPLPEASEPSAPAEGFGFDTPREEPKVIPFEPPPPSSFFEAPPAELEPPAFSAETTAFPKMSFEDLQRMRDESAPPAAEELPWTSAPEPLIGGSDAQEASGGESADAAPEPAPQPATLSAGSISDEDIDRIARRVVELMSDKAVRDVAWEVIPDLAQAIVRERIKELEAEG